MTFGSVTILPWVPLPATSRVVRRSLKSGRESEPAKVEPFTVCGGVNMSLAECDYRKENLLFCS